MENKQFAKLGAFRQAPAAIQALVGKMVHDPQAPRTSSGQNKNINLNRFGLERISNNTAQDILDSDSIMQLLPDLELAEQILVGSILSPKDMSTADATIVVAENQFEGQIASPLLEVVSDHFKHDYKIDERLDIQLENIITRSGATILLVLPENNIDAMINGNQRLSMEHFEMAQSRLQTHKQLGLLGHPTTQGISMESFSGRLEDAAKVRDLKGNPLEYVTVTDNFNILKKSSLNQRARSLRISDRISSLNASLEDATQNMGPVSLNTAQIDALYNNRIAANKAIEVITPQSYMNRPSVGHPLAMELPSEAVIPVYRPGRPDEHVGYFVLIDIHGRFVSKSGTRDYYNEMRSNFKQGSTSSTGGNDNSSELLRLTREAMGVGDTGSTGFEYEEVQRTYATIMENDWQNRLRNGMYGEELEIGFTEEILRIMMQRQYKKQNTQVLYVPVELVSYIAFNYNKDGIGQTMLAKSKILSNMRSILLFAETMAGVRNAVGRKKVNITLDPDDPDKQDTVSKIQSLIMETARHGFPIGAPDPGQSLDYLNRAAFDFAINADSDDYGQTKVEYDDYTSSIQAGNPDLQDRLRRMQVSGLGVPPEKVDPTASPDFAVGVVQNDLIMTRRVKRFQRIFCQGQTKFVRVYTRNSSLLIDRLLKVVTENEGLLSEEQQKMSPEDLVRDFIDALELKLPEPDTTRTDLMLQSFTQFNSLLDEALGAWITVDMFPDDSFEGASSAADRFKSVVKSFFQRQYLAQNNILPELNVLHEMDGDKPAFNLLDAQEQVIASLGTQLHAFLMKERALREKWKKNFPAAPADDGFGNTGGDTGAGDGFGDTGDGFGGDDFGAPGEPPADDFGASLDTPEETPQDAEETPPEAADGEAEANAAVSGANTPEEEEDDNNQDDTLDLSPLPKP